MDGVCLKLVYMPGSVWRKLGGIVSFGRDAPRFQVAIRECEGTRKEIRRLLPAIWGYPAAARQAAREQG